jgi:predicted ArsR family transcriptional regulator
MKAAEERVAQMAEQTTTQTDEVKQRLDELRAESDAAKERVDGLVGEQDTKFTEAQEERRKRFDDSLDVAKAALSNTQEELDRAVGSCGSACLL